jgi:hypothetical protein
LEQLFVNDAAQTKKKKKGERGSFGAPNKAGSGVYLFL